MGGGKGDGGSVTIPNELIDIAERLTGLSEQAFAISKPGLIGGANVLQDVLKTGGSQAITPAIAGAVEQSRRANSQALRNTGEQLDLAGITGTQREDILGNMALQGEFQTSQVGPEAVLPLILQTAGTSTGLGATGLSGVGGAGQLLTPAIHHSAGGKGK